tara:strand:- start:246 stop:539 length:294 start_codon:yes stop_codon:yes gene_type:complete
MNGINFFKKVSIGVKRNKMLIIMARIGINGIRKAVIFGLYHTISDKDKKRLWKMVSSGQLMHRGFFIRKHILNKNYRRKCFTEQYPLMLFFFFVFIL